MEFSSRLDKTDGHINFLSLIWIVLGVYQIYFGFDNYYNYSIPGLLWMFMVPEYHSIKNIYFGILSWIIGICMRKKQPKVYSLLALYGLLIPIILFWELLYRFFKFNYLWGVWEVFSTDLFIYILILVTIKVLKSNNTSSIQKEEKISFWNHKITIVLSCVVVTLLITFLSKIFTYYNFCLCTTKRIQWYIFITT